MPAKKALPSVTLLHGDCLNLLPRIADQKIAFMFADLPYSQLSAKPTTRHLWDIGIDLKELWHQARQVADKTLIAAFTCQPRLGASLLCSNASAFLYDLIWQKTSSATFLQAKRRPLCFHESIYIFREGAPRFYPQMRQRKDGRTGKFTIKSGTSAGHALSHRETVCEYKAEMYPSSVVCISSVPKRQIEHPTQKPVALLEWLIRTFTNEGDTVLDPVAGSGTTAIAAIRTGRNVICIEKDAKYYETMCKRVKAEQAQQRMTL